MKDMAGGQSELLQHNLEGSRRDVTRLSHSSPHSLEVGKGGTYVQTAQL